MGLEEYEISLRKETMQSKHMPPAVAETAGGMLE